MKNKYYPLLFILSLSMMQWWGCTNGSRISNVKLTPLDTNVLRFHLTYDYGGPEAGILEYWSDSTTIKYRINTKSDDNGWSADIMNLLPETKYNYRVLIPFEHDTLLSDVSSFQTGILPQEIGNYELVKNNLTNDNGYVLLRKFHDPGSQVILNMEGKVVWYEIFDKKVARPFYLTNQSSYLTLYDTLTIREYDFNGNVILNIPVDSINDVLYFHHDVLYASDGNIIALTKVKGIFDLTQLGGSARDTVYTDGVVKLDKNGRTLWQWSLFDVLNPMNLSDIMEVKHDLGHANAVHEDKNGDLLISFRDFNQIWKISPEGNLLWQLGERGDFSMPDEANFVKQHSIYFLSPIEDELMIFDNGANKIRPYSRVLTLKIDQDSLQAKVGKDIKLPNFLATYRMGNADYISDDKILVCSPRKRGQFVIINSQGEVIWHVKSSHSSYRAKYLNEFPGS